MSLDVWLVYEQPKTQQELAIELLRANGFDRQAGILDVQHDEERIAPVFEYNITHNLGKMADAAGIYQHLWRPDELGVKKAKDLISPLENGLRKLQSDPEFYEKHNPANGWGSYEGLVRFVQSYLAACRDNPEANICVSR